jgi:beta-glucosidase
LPNGIGQPNQRGIDFYSRLVDALLEAGIAPWVTLFHWDLPAPLYDQGGFASRDSASWFADYASVVCRAIGDRVEHWMTLNEPQIFSILGYLTAEHAPGLVDFPAYVSVAHHVHLAHGRAVQALRSASSKAKVGIVEQFFPVHPLTDTDADRDAAHRVDGLFNRWYLDAVLKGRYPDDVLAMFSMLDSPLKPGDFEVVTEPLDFIGLNHYTRQFARHDSNVPLFEFSVDQEHRVAGAGYTDMGWEVCPPAFGEVLTRLRTEYDNPLVYVTENGAAMPDVVENGRVHDPRRQAYFEAYLRELQAQMDLGSNVGGYFVWSFTDNFEWAHGYDKRFGLVHVDYATQRRTVKDSARWYSSVIRNSGF